MYSRNTDISNTLFSAHICKYYLFFRIHCYQDACLLVCDAGTVGIYQLYELKFRLHIHGNKILSTLKMEYPHPAETYVNTGLHGSHARKADI